MDTRSEEKRVYVGVSIAGIVAAAQCSVLGGRAAAAPCRAAQS